MSENQKAEANKVTDSAVHAGALAAAVGVKMSLEANSKPTDHEQSTPVTKPDAMPASGHSAKDAAIKHPSTSTASNSQAGEQLNSSDTKPSSSTQAGPTQLEFNDPFKEVADVRREV